MVARQRHSYQRNDRLRAAMTDQQATVGDLAKLTGNHAKTVQRWLYEGRVPRRKTADAVAEFLNIDPDWLWPTSGRQSTGELVGLYAHIGELSPTIWVWTMRQARQHIDIATDTDTAPILPYGLADILHTQTARGVQVRLCIGGLVSTAGFEGPPTRINPGHPMIGIYRFDDQMFVWPSGGAFSIEHMSPMLHLRRTKQHGLFDFYARTFHTLWQQGHDPAVQTDDWIPTSLRR